MMVWQAAERNEWEVAIRQALAGTEGSPAGASASVFCFCFCFCFCGSGGVLARRPPVVTRILEAAGFAAVSFTDVDEPVDYGPDVPFALDFVCGFAFTRDALSRLDPAAAARALGRLREMLAAHVSDDGVWFGSRAWIVTARRI